MKKSVPPDGMIPENPIQSSKSMSIFGSIRNLMSSQPEAETLWSVPENEGDIDDILKNYEKPQIIYKHSYRCSISLFSKSSLDSGAEDLRLQADIYMIDVVSRRSLSAYVAEKTGVIHQSPQVLLLHKGQPFWQASHGDVRIENLKEALRELTGSSNLA